MGTLIFVDVEDHGEGFQLRTQRIPKIKTRIKLSAYRFVISSNFNYLQFKHDVLHGIVTLYDWEKIWEKIFEIFCRK